MKCPAAMIAIGNVPCIVGSLCHKNILLGVKNNVLYFSTTVLKFAELMALHILTYN